MKPVMQTKISPVDGDCARACVASMFELDITQVPNFILFGDKWFNVYFHFLQGLGYMFYGIQHPDNEIKEEYLINGCVYVSVRSRSFQDITHGVLINKHRVVIHDPNPNKAWQGTDLAESGEMISWQLIRLLS